MTTDNVSALEALSPGRYQLDPQRSQVSYSGRHMFGLGTVHATFAITSGEVQVADPFIESRAVVSVDAASFTSNSAKRDTDVKSPSLLNVADYPEITFRSSSLEQISGGWKLSGTVTAHGEVVPVDVLLDEATPEPGGVRLHALAKRLDRYAFGVTGGKGMVGRYLDLDLDVLAVRA